MKDNSNPNVYDVHKALYNSEIIYKNIAQLYLEYYRESIAPCDNKRLSEVLAIIYASQFFKNAFGFLIGEHSMGNPQKLKEIPDEPFKGYYAYEYTQRYAYAKSKTTAEVTTRLIREWVENPKRQEQIPIDEFAKFCNVPQIYLSAALYAANKN